MTVIIKKRNNRKDGCLATVGCIEQALVYSLNYPSLSTYYMQTPTRCYGSICFRTIYI